MSIRLPGEHGAWGILLVPMVASALLAQGEWFPFALVAIAALGLFVLRSSFEQHNRFHSLCTVDHLLLALLTLASCGALIFYYGRTQLIYLAAVGSALFALHAWLLRRHRPDRGEKRSLAGELVGVLLLTLTAPAAWIAQRGTLDISGAKVWLLNVLFFAGGVLYVKYRVRGLLAHRKFGSVRERAAFAWPVVAYHFLLLFFLLALIGLDWLSLGVLAAFVPGIVRAHGLLLHLGRKFPIKQLGWAEVGHAVLFAALLCLSLD